MDDTQTDNDFESWFSTYGLITAERVLGKYRIKLPQSLLFQGIKNKSSFYHLLLQLPIDNLFTGVILQQANDYQIYVQKIFIDYLLSGESGKDEEAQGASLRAAIEIERQNLVILGEDFNAKELAHYNLISSSQASLIRLIDDWNKAFESAIRSTENILKKNSMVVKKSQLRQAITNALIHYDLRDASSETHVGFIDEMNKITQLTLDDLIKDNLLKKMAELFEVTHSVYRIIDEFTETASQLRIEAISFRTQFYQTILRVTEMIRFLPDYRINSEQDFVNRESLYFDKTIGEA